MRATEPTPGDVNGVSGDSKLQHGTGPSVSCFLIPEEPLGLPELCERVHGGIQAFLEEETEDALRKRVQAQTKTALSIIAEALERYSLPQLSLSYNGGKDCLVVLILHLSALQTHHLRHCSSPTTPCAHYSPIQSVYIQAPHPFPAVESFVQASERLYSLSLSRYTASSMKTAFANYLDDHPTVRAIFVGTRRTDPHGALLKHFDMTDGGWPAFMRCHPVMDWHYGEIWMFLRHFGVPYCGLYDEGYTSLGGTDDTARNPALRVEEEGEGEARYRPAYELVEDVEERLGRERGAIASLKKVQTNSV